MPPRFPTAVTTAPAPAPAPCRPLPSVARHPEAVPPAAAELAVVGADTTAPRTATVGSEAPEVTRALGLLDATLGVLGAFRAELARLAAERPPRGDAPAPAPGGLPPRPLTAREVARHLSVQVRTVNAWCAAGRFPGAVPLGRAGWRIPPDAVAAGIAAIAGEAAGVQRLAS